MFLYTSLCGTCVEQVFVGAVGRKGIVLLFLKQLELCVLVVFLCYTTVNIGLGELHEKDL